MSYVELPEEMNFSTKSDTFIIAYCPDTDSWFVTKERFFYYEYPKEFMSEEDGICYFKNNIRLFFDRVAEMKTICCPIGVYLENTKQFFTVSNE